MKSSAIICSDLHIRETTPECRLDDFMETQKRKYVWLRNLQEEHNGIPIIVAGDIFNHWKPSPWLLAWTLENLPDNIICIPGQHDLPAHNLEDIQRSGIQVLASANKITLLEPKQLRSVYTATEKFNISGFPWGVSLQGYLGNSRKKQVALIHYGVYKKDPHYPGAENNGGTALSVIKKMPGFDLIVSGDNHLTFTEQYKNQLLINPGSFMRTTAAQIDHKPSVFLWYSENNTFEQIFVPIEKNVISRIHIDRNEIRDERLEAFVSKLDHNIEISISYRENMKQYLAKNKIDKSICDIIWRVIS